MNMIEVSERTEDIIDALFHVWKASVEATHTFLSQKEIDRLGTTLPEILSTIPHLLVVLDASKHPIAFAGIRDHDLDLLFIDPNYRRKGIGSMLIQTAISKFQVDALCVNEQNPEARAFYEHQGFYVVKRSECDERGNPYPLLYMKKRI